MTIYEYGTQALYTVMQTAFFLYFALYPYRDALRFGKTHTILLSSLYLSVLLIIDIAVGYKTSPLRQFLWLGLSIWIAIHILACLTLIRGKLYRLMFSALSLLAFFNHSSCFADALSMLWHLPDSLTDYSSLIKPLYDVIILALISPVLWYINCVLVERIEKLSPAFTGWKFIWVLPLPYYLTEIMAGLLDNDLTTVDSLRMNLFWHACSFLFAAVSITVILRLVLKIHQNLLVQKEREILAHQIMTQKVYCLKLEESMRKQQRQRHDFRHHMMVLQNLMEKGLHERLSEYIGRYIGELVSQEPVRLCQNTIANTLLNRYLAECRGNHVRFAAHVEIPEQMLASDQELCVVLGNLLENALEAAVKCPQQSAYVSVFAQVHGSQLLLRIENSCIEDTGHKKAPGPAVGAERVRGIGLASVQEVVRRIHGSIELSHGEDRYQADLILPI